MSVTFWKYHGLGNDFLLVDHRGKEDIPAETTRAVCARHTGVGADGILALRAGVDGEPFMRVFNSDGSVADMCGNGLRCFVKWLVADLGFPAAPLVVGSDAGPQHCIPIMDGARVRAVSVNLGPADVRGPLSVAVGRAYEGTDLFLGNPHYVLERAPEPGEVSGRGPALSTHAAFPAGTNVEWLEVLNPTTANVTVYERGCGPTQACGTGGAGAVAVGVLKGLLQTDATISVTQPGGTMEYRVEDDGAVWMTGPAEFVFEGRLSTL